MEHLTSTTLSDATLKENVVDATPKLSDLLALQVRNFNFITDPQKVKHLGFIAQEFEAVFPSLVEEQAEVNSEQQATGRVFKVIKTPILLPILVKALQEQQQEIESLKARDIYLTDQIQTMSNGLAELVAAKIVELFEQSVFKIQKV